jgi:hypothetical protein
MRAVALGDPARLRGLALAGAEVVACAQPQQAHAAVAALPGDVALVVLSPELAGAARELEAERPELLWCLLPDET